MPLSEGKTVVADNVATTVTEEDDQVMLVEGGTKIEDLVEALNRIGTSPRDLIAILQAIKAAGALQAELIIM